MNIFNSCHCEEPKATWQPSFVAKQQPQNISLRKLLRSLTGSRRPLRGLVITTEGWLFVIPNLFRDLKINFAFTLLSILSFLFIPVEAFSMQETAKYENYLNELKTFSGDFTQTDSKGRLAHGQIQISRPGKMRLSYAPPSSLLILANGKWLVTKDSRSDEVDYVSLENTPAAFILRPQVRFSGDVMVTNLLPKNDNTTEISLTRTQDPDSGYITLIFEDDPLSLKGWKVYDAQGETRVILSNIQENIPLSSDLFHIEGPNLLQRIF